jgi:hypothetical protein
MTRSSITVFWTYYMALVRLKWALILTEHCPFKTFASCSCAAYLIYWSNSSKHPSHPFLPFFHQANHLILRTKYLSKKIRTETTYNVFYLTSCFISLHHSNPVVIKKRAASGGWSAIHLSGIPLFPFINQASNLSWSTKPFHGERHI